MRNIVIREYDLSQFHAGQIITPSAHICRDLEGIWHSVVQWGDASDRSVSVDHETHATEAQADKCVAGQVRVSSDRDRSIDMAGASKLIASLEKLGIGCPRVTFDPLTCVLAVGEVETTDPEREIRQQVKARGIYWEAIDGYRSASARRKNQRLAAILS